MLNSLREATADLHQELEKENLANKITDHTITLKEYQLLMLQNLLAYQTAEAEIAKFLDISKPSKTELIKKDLDAMNQDFDNAVLNFHVNNKAEAIGAAYVIMGSAMGGFVIGRELKKCPELKSLPEQHFYAEDREGVQSWNVFSKMLKSHPFTSEEISLAQEKAKETFELFAVAYNREFSLA